TGFHRSAGASCGPSGTLRGPVRRSQSAAMLLRQFCAACARSRSFSSTCTSFSAAANTAGLTSGPTGGAVPKAGGVPGDGSAGFAAGAGVWASPATGAVPSRAAADVSRNSRRELGTANTSGTAAQTVPPPPAPRSFLSQCRARTRAHLAGSRGALSLQVLSEPRLHLLVEVPAVLGLEDPVPRVRPPEQAARHLHALQDAPVLERIADRDAEIPLADAQQDRRLPVLSVGDGALLAPDGTPAPGGAVIGELATVDRIALAPLGGQIH